MNINQSTWSWYYNNIDSNVNSKINCDSDLFQTGYLSLSNHFESNIAIFYVI